MKRKNKNKKLFCILSDVCFDNAFNNRLIDKCGSDNVFFFFLLLLLILGVGPRIDRCYEIYI